MNRFVRERDVVAGMAVFVAVVESGSLAAAARRTGLTPSAVSKLVTRLERGLGTPLLRRTTRSMTLTEAGQTFLERARTILHDVRGVAEEMSSHNAEPRGLVRVSASLLLGQTRVVPMLFAFQKRAPAVSLDIDLTDRLVDMVGERIDVAVRLTAEPPPSFVARRVGTVRRVLCASPSYLRGRRAPRIPGDLAEHSCILLAGPESSAVWRLVAGSAASAPEDVRVAGRLRVSNSLSLLDATKAGLGIADLPRYLVEGDLQARRLVRVLDAFEPPERGVFVVHAASRALPARVRALTSYLIPELTKALH